jgi:hypothetical protein
MEGITKINWSIVSLDKIDSISKLFHNKSMIFLYTGFMIQCFG